MVGKVVKEGQMLKKKLTLVLAVAMSLSLSACWESTDVTVHKAGKYIGATDSKLTTSGASRADGLQKRFKLVQVDR